MFRKIIFSLNAFFFAAVVLYCALNVAAFAKTLTCRGEVMAATLDSAVGDCSFLTHSVAADRIFKVCKMQDECEVVAVMKDDWIAKVVSVRLIKKDLLVAPQFELTTKYPWLVKPQGELTYTECATAMNHDSNYWWARGKCHMRFIRYAFGVVIRDVAAQEAPDSIMRKGEIFTGITQYRRDEGTYCAHGGYCYQAKNIKLLGSILTGPYGDKVGDETDQTQGVETSCELILADRNNIIKAGAEEMLEGCH